MILEEDQGMVCMSQVVKLIRLAQSFEMFVEYTKRNNNSVVSQKCVAFWYDQFSVFNLGWFPVLPLL